MSVLLIEFWSSTKGDEFTNSGYMFDLGYETGRVGVFKLYEFRRYSVRCIKD